jgi:hypothetical protein
VQLQLHHNVLAIALANKLAASPGRFFSKRNKTFTRRGLCVT